ncbi:MAG: hypothetical protein DMF64_22310 [Acidobacteria bacterium]|nr:MAG: hypothetical protein DMF64_22310 [Acidobacteriota bacterium]
MDTTAYRLDEITLGRKAFWIVSLVFALVVAAVIVNYGRQQESVRATKATLEKKEEETVAKRREETKALETQAQKDKSDLEALARQIALAPRLRYALQGSGYIKGRTVFINKETKAAEYMTYDLPSELKAERPQDLGTIILLDWSSERVGKYDDGQPGYVYLCTVSVIDKSIPAVVGTKRFRGGDPPSYKKTYGPAYGTQPTYEILSYVKGLPRK